MLTRGFLTCLALLSLGVPGFSQPSQKDSLPEMLHEGGGSIRAISVVNNRVIWVSGSEGSVGLTKDGGEHWQWRVLPGGQDFRCLKAFSARKAVLINAGGAAHILLTRDGGKSWDTVYTNSKKGIFFDGICFWDNRRGIAVSDPLDGKFFLIRTKDRGKTWNPLPASEFPGADSGEASFAASNSTLVPGKGKQLWLASGGILSRVFYSSDGGESWQVYQCPILQGKSSTGIFSLAFLGSKQGIAVGGDYLADSVRLNNAMLSSDGGKTWASPVVNPLGYRSSVVYLNSRVLVATGVTGTDISRDGGSTWHQLSPEGFNVVQTTPDGRIIFLAGSNGRIARFILNSK